MLILWIEDKLLDIEGLREQCKSKGWMVEHKLNFYEALTELADNTRSYNVVVLDTILPAGNIPENVNYKYMPRKGGKLLLEMMRGTGDGQKLLEILPFKKDIYAQHVETPVIILSRTEDFKDECFNLGIEDFFPKSDYDWRALIRTLEVYAKD
jgi:hypothetical protein